MRNGDLLAMYSRSGIATPSLEQFGTMLFQYSLMSGMVNTQKVFYGVSKHFGIYYDKAILLFFPLKRLEEALVMIQLIQPFSVDNIVEGVLKIIESDMITST